MKILSIGNSFSQDAQRYLYKIAKANQEEALVVNLYIGGCPLRTHYFHMLDDEAAYSYEFNGISTGLNVSIKEALKSQEWDYVTLQQASHESFKPDSYIPYLKELNAYVKRYAPQAKIYLHQTWAYPEQYPRLKEVGFSSTEEMFAKVKTAYDMAAEQIHADGIIRSGEAMLRAYQVMQESVYRDPIHAGLGFGRYLLGIVWFCHLFGVREDFRHMTEFDIPVTKQEQELAYEIAGKGTYS